VALVAVAAVAVWFLLAGSPKPATGVVSQETPTPPPGSASRSGVPEWVPIFPGGRVSDVETRPAGVETYTNFRMAAGSDCEKVINWYEEKMKLAGFNVQKTSSWTSGCSGLIRGEGPGNTRSLRLNGGGDNRTSDFGVSAVVRSVPGGESNDASIPSWVPQYPNSTAENLVSTQAGPERRVAFNFATNDDAQTLISWYESRLKEAQFVIVSSTVFDSSKARLTANDATGRSILNLRIEPAGSRKVVAVEAREGVR